jgi:uncharacterized protein YndB with AHSA1/START domain
MHGSLKTVESRPTLRIERRLDHSVERVWRAISEPAELARWFLAPVQWRPELGEVFEGEGGRGEITELAPPRRIAWVWGDELFRFELSPEGDGCLLVFTHVFDDRALGAQHAAGWEIYLNRLDAHLAGGFLSEEAAHAVFPSLHERYAERFALDPAVGRRTFAKMQASRLTLEEGPTLRLQRRYDHPLERVWRAITDPEELRHWFPPGEELALAECDPPHMLAGVWYGDRLRFELRSEGDGCVLTFTHQFADRAKAARDAAGWESCFLRFDALLAGKPLSEAVSLETWPQIHERYAEKFGVDPGLGRKAFAQHQSGAH